jgi:hypothetical protein
VKGWLHNLNGDVYHAQHNVYILIKYSKNRFAKEINSVATIILFHFRPGNVEKMKNKKRNRKEGNS